nr:RNA-directed DNA polymerase, eukaryota [Tanacetum cinerariifolium]
MHLAYSIFRTFSNLATILDDGIRNEGGKKFCTTVDTLTQREPDSLLAAMFSGRHTVCMDSEKEIKRAVWDCGIAKALGPDGFTFGFYRWYWDIIGNDVVDAVKWFFCMERSRKEDAPKSDSNALIRMFKKFKYLKYKIREWNRTFKDNLNNRKKGLKADLSECNSIIDSGEAGVDIVNRRNEVITLLHDMHNIQSLEMAQKTKIKRAIEGDVNSKYFHNIFNKRRSQQNIRDRFDQPNGKRLRIEMNFPKRISSDQQADLECDVSKEEIKMEVWDCGIDKSPGSFPKGTNSSFVALIPKIPNANMVKDFRPITIIGSIYKIISKILANRLVTVLGDLVNDVQSAFVADRQILYGPFILNELVQWCKKKKKQSMLFKVDFEKSYDSIRWDYLDDVVRKFGFEENWCTWIQSCLRSSRGSVIVNDIPTEEFQFYKGLKQGDHLSPFLFILVMETLHISFQRVVDAANIDTIIKVLECFHCASGLRINMSKSKILGISVEVEKVLQRMESIRSYFFNGMEYASKKASWVKWEYMLSSKDKGGIGVVIIALLGEDGKIGKKSKTCYTSIWIDIINEMERLKKRGGLDLMSFIHSKLGDGKHTKFWDVSWCGSGDYSVSLVRALIDGVSLPEVSTKTRWIKEVPIKINVHTWKVKLNCLPTRLNISRRGMDIDSILCSMCDKAVESSRHLFFNCPVSKEALRKIARWWDIEYDEVSSYDDWLQWILSLRLPRKHTHLLEGICYVLWWDGVVPNLSDVECSELVREAEYYQLL